MHPVVFETDFFGLLSKPWALHSYGLLIATGFLSAMMLAKRQASFEGEDPDQVVDIAFYLLLTGLIGARFVFILTKLDEYLRNPLDILMFWRGGLVFYGSFIGASLYMIYYTRRHRMNFFKFADMFVPYLAMAHTFGRLGCVGAGCCFGKVTDVAWGIVFPVGSMTHQAHQSTGLVGVGESPLPVHPTQLYEGGAELMMFAVLMAMRPYKRFHGQLLLTWLVCYSIIRSIIELFRGDTERGFVFLNVSTSQFISICVAAVAAGLYYYLRKKQVTSGVATV